MASSSSAARSIRFRGHRLHNSDKSSFAPSLASGIKVSEYEALTDGEKDELMINDDLVSSVTWLLERERGNVDFRKYSGTLEHPRHTDKQGATINAFQHFTYLNSNKSLLLTDIQLTVGLVITVTMGFRHLWISMSAAKDSVVT
ncbi:hypothetical protein B0H14DRAFT_2555344 [Mycena olivaceomarginata]|nr:hypothetical protein B0H14DRAFT_2555344 [Mycena olivaceomarginata]